MSRWTVSAPRARSKSAGTANSINSSKWHTSGRLGASLPIASERALDKASMSLLACSADRSLKELNDSSPRKVSCKSRTCGKTPCIHTTRKAMHLRWKRRRTQHFFCDIREQCNDKRSGHHSQTATTEHKESEKGRWVCQNGRKKTDWERGYPATDS
jgi:hypothetical protein